MSVKPMPARYYNGGLEIKSRADDHIIERILNDETLYYGGPPQWRQGRTRKRCKSSSEADAERLRLIKVIRRHGHTAEAFEIADRLAGCRPYARCHSGACPACMRALQRWLVTEGDRLLNPLEADEDEACILSIIPTKARSQAKDARNALRRHGRRRRK